MYEFDEFQIEGIPIIVEETIEKRDRLEKQPALIHVKSMFYKDEQSQ